MIKNYIEKANFEDTGFSYTLSLINGKYKMVILYCLMEFDVVRYSELKRYPQHIAQNTQPVAERAGKRQAHHPHRISADSAQSGIQPVGARQIADDDTRPALHMGRGK